MANLNSVLNERIARLSRKEIKSQTGPARRLVLQHRRDIAVLKRIVATLQKRLAGVEKVATKVAGSEPAPQLPDKTRFRVDGLIAHRKRLELSAENYGKLVGVTGLTVYAWESRKSRPRDAQLAKLFTIRGIGKREAEKTSGASRRQARLPPRRPQLSAAGQTAEEYIRELLKTKSATTSSQINVAWKSSGRHRQRRQHPEPHDPRRQIEAGETQRRAGEHLQCEISDHSRVIGLYPYYYPY